MIQSLLRNMITYNKILDINIESFDILIQTSLIIHIMKILRY